MSKTAQNLIVILGLIAVALGGYFMLQQPGATTLSFESNDSVRANIQAETQLFIQRGQQLRRINLDLDFFADQRFTSLQAYRTPIVEQPVGRDNPFQTIIPLATDVE
jgi:hypothetical protein